MPLGLSGSAIHAIIAFAPLWIPAAIYVPLPTLVLDWSFTPRGTVYSNQVAPIFFAPFAKPENWLIATSRFVQCTILLCLTKTELGLLWISWIPLALLRSGTGYLLTRSVGWAYPSLFSHWALYESASGIGPILVIYLVLHGTTSIRSTPFVDQITSKQYAIPVLAVAMCWLECRPWTYGTALLGALVVGIGRLLYRRQSRLPRPSIEKQTYTGLGLHQFLPCCLAVLVPWLVIYHLIPPTRIPLSSTQEPLLDILLLSFPRPVPIETSVQIIETTVNSFIPYLSPAVTLSMFTHASDHQALKTVHDRTPHTSLHVDLDTHPGDTDGHYLHLAEAFRWMMEDETKLGEWVMLVEDDFPVCHGSRGWDVITTVVAELEKDRLGGNIRSGFIGTGGSGIIIHRSYLPTLIFLLRSLSIANSPLHPDFVRRNPDEIIHDCILGRRYSFCERHDGDQRKLLISSRLVLDHIGGMATTTEGKSGNTDKWRCGWRHAFHGDEGVDVMVV